MAILSARFRTQDRQTLVSSGAVIYILSVGFSAVNRDDPPDSGRLTRPSDGFRAVNRSTPSVGCSRAVNTTPPPRRWPLQNESENIFSATVILVRALNR